MANDWLELRQHAETGIETIKAPFPVRSSSTVAVNATVASRAMLFYLSPGRSMTVMRR